ncbi:MAG: M16 family metallopeptidase [Thermoanaerobaculia bacterium]
MSVRSRLRIRRVDGSPIVAIRILLPGGARFETIPGQALVTGRMLAEGTARRDYAKISADAEARGMMVSSFGGYEAHGLAIDALADDWREAIGWAAELLFESSFPADRVAWLARQAAAELDAQADEADTFTGREHMAQLWAPHPRSRPLQGDRESLGRLDPDSCRSYHRRGLAGERLVSIAGEIDVESVGRFAEERFGSDGSADGNTPDGHRGAPEEPAASPEPHRTIRTRARDQAHLYLSHRTVRRGDPDYVALEVAGVILGAGSGLSGRIPHRIREQQGLAYTATADTVAGASLDTGRLAVYVGTSPETVAAAEAAARDEIDRFVAGPLAPSEVADARSYLLGREPFRRETARQWADLMASAMLLDLPLDDPDQHAREIAALGPEEIERAVGRHLHPDRLVATVGLPSD